MVGLWFDGDGTTDDDVDDDGDGATGDDDDDDGDGATGCDNEDDGDGRRRAMKSPFIFTGTMIPLLI